MASPAPCHAAQGVRTEPRPGQAAHGGGRRAGGGRGGGAGGRGVGRRADSVKGIARGVGSARCTGAGDGDT